MKRKQQPDKNVCFQYLRNLFTLLGTLNMIMKHLALRWNTSKYFLVLVN